MKSISLRYLFILLLSLPLLTACDDEEEEPGLSKTDMLTAQTWQGEAVFASGIDVTEDEDLQASMMDVRTLSIDFEADGTYSATYMEDGAPVSGEGEWEFRDNETVLYFDLLDDYVFNVKELTDANLVLSTTVTYQTFNIPAEVHFVAK